MGSNHDPATYLFCDLSHIVLSYKGSVFRCIKGPIMHTFKCIVLINFLGSSVKCEALYEVTFLTIGMELCWRMFSEENPQGDKSSLPCIQRKR